MGRDLTVMVKGPKLESKKKPVSKLTKYPTHAVTDMWGCSCQCACACTRATDVWGQDVSGSEKRKGALRAVLRRQGIEPGSTGWRTSQ